MDYAKVSLEKHYEWKGKIESAYRVPVSTKEELCLAYTPGVAEPCMAIHNDVNKSYELTRRWNTVPVITDGTAVLGLGDIGPEAGMPVMEGKCALFKTFADVDAFPICIRSKDVDELVRMGAKIRTEGRVAVIEGVKRLYGASVVSPDLRGGSALVLAGLTAHGTTEVGSLKHIDRGYENFENNLCMLNADIIRME